MAISRTIISAVKATFSFFSSLKTAIPLIVITIVVTIIVSLFPQPDLFSSWWYLSLLGLNGISLLFITIYHTPMILQRKGRNALIGVVTTHLGILILIAGAIYGGVSGFRYSVKAIEGEMTVVPGLPFIIHLDKLIIEDYPRESVAHLDPEIVPKRRQDGQLSLYKNGELWKQIQSAPGKPAKVEGITILLAFKDIGWYFELIVTDPIGRDKIIPVRPWEPPLINLGETQIMAHSLMDTGELSAQILTMTNEQVTPLGTLRHGQDLELNGYTVALGATKRYTGLFVYNRPQAPILIIGCLAMFLGLIWHFYHRHRDRRIKSNPDKVNQAHV